MSTDCINETCDEPVPSCEKEPTGEVKKSNDLSHYIVESDNKFLPTPYIELIPRLESGLYSIYWDSNKRTYGFRKTQIITDELLLLPNGIFEEILNDISFFWSNKDAFTKYKFAFKRGILLYGEPGCGKTCLTSLLSKQVINDYDGLVFILKDDDDLGRYLESIPSSLRLIEPDRPMLIIFEDLDGLCSHEKTEATLLNLLDGMTQFENCVYIGCTNYPEKLKDRILNRPSRFDKRYHIGKPSEDVREFYFNAKIKKDDLKKIDIEEYVKKTEGLSLAHLGEVIKSVFIYKKNLNDVIQELQNMGNFISSTKFTVNQNMGFKKKE